MAQSGIESITLKNGHEIGPVYSIFQDKQGYIWVGSQNGLYRYDSRQLVSASELCGHNYTNGVITCITEDKDQNLWIATSEGCFKLSADRQQIESIFPKLWNDTAIAKHPSVHDVFCDEKTLWLTSHFGLEKLDLKTGAKKNFPIFRNTKIAENKKGTTCLKQDKNGDFWMGTDYGLCYFSKKNETWKYYYLDVETGIADASENCVIDVCLEQDSLLLLGTWASGVKLFNPLNGQIKTLTYSLPGENIGSRNIVHKVIKNPSSSNSYLLAALDQGVGQLNTQNNTISFDQVPYTYLQSSGVRTLYCDREKNTWIGTNSGLFFKPFIAPKFSQLDLSQLEKNGTTSHIIAAAEDLTNDNVYLATFTNGCWIWNPTNGNLEKWKEVTIAETGVIFDFYVENGSLYVLSQKKNFVFDLKTKTKKPLFNGSQEQLSELNYLGNNNFLAHRFLRTPLISNLKNDQITEIGMHNAIAKKMLSTYSTSLPAENDSFYFGTYRHGLGRYSLTTGKAECLVEFYHDIPIHDIYSMVDDGLGKIWFATGRRGLFSYHKTTHAIENFRSFNGIVINGIYKIIKDQKGVLWLSTTRGLIRFDPKNNSSTLYSTVDGLLENHIDGDILLLSNKTILIPNSKGLSYARITDLEKPGKQYKLTLNYFKINNEFVKVKNHSSLELKYDENNFSIEFALLSFKQSKLNAYEYKLVGYQDEWVRSSSNKIDFVKVPPGTYTLVTRAFNYEGSPSKNTFTLNIFIAKPFWKTIWFLTICVLVFGAIIVIVFRYRVKQLKKVHALRNKIASDLHDEIGSALSSIKMYSGYALHQDMSNGNKEIFQKIHHTTSDSIENMSDIVWSINPKNDTFDRVLVKMKSFSDSVLPPLGIVINYTLASRKPTLTMDQRRHFYLFYKEVIHNIAKYSKAKNVGITFVEQQGKWILKIEDDGIGFDLQTVTLGNGLQNLKSRAVQLKGEVNIISEVNLGTTILLTFRATGFGS